MRVIVTVIVAVLVYWAIMIVGFAAVFFLIEGTEAIGLKYSRFWPYFLVIPLQVIALWWGLRRWVVVPHARAVNFDRKCLISLLVLGLLAPLILELGTSMISRDPLSVMRIIPVLLGGATVLFGLGFWYGLTRYWTVEGWPHSLPVNTDVFE